MIIHDDGGRFIRVPIVRRYRGRGNMRNRVLLRIGHYIVIYKVIEDDRSIVEYGVFSPAIGIECYFQSKKIMYNYYIVCGQLVWTGQTSAYHLRSLAFELLQRLV